MSFDVFTAALYQRLYPPAVLLCVAVGVLCYAAAEPLSAFNNFAAAAFGIGLDERVRRRWFERAETESSRGWARERLPTPVR